jgi:hypothetical protein
MLVYCEDGPLNGKKIEVPDAVLEGSVTAGDFEGRRCFKEPKSNSTYVHSVRSHPNDPEAGEEELPVFVHEAPTPNANRMLGR